MTTNNNDRDSMLMQWAAQAALAERAALIEDFEFDGEPRLVLAAPDIAGGLNAKRIAPMSSLALDMRTAAAILRDAWLFRVDNLAAHMRRAIAETWGVTAAGFEQARKDYDALCAEESRRAREADLAAGDYGVGPGEDGKADRPPAAAARSADSGGGIDAGNASGETPPPARRA